MKKWQETEDENFDPDTLERGLGGGGASAKNNQVKIVCRLCLSFFLSFFLSFSSLFLSVLLI
jgi:hypothetical protein